MYNGIGLTTPRGSGTNGYVQRNLSSVRAKRQRDERGGKRDEKDRDRLDSQLNRQPNAEILEHQRKRQLEVKCAELQDMMEEQGYSVEEIEEKVNSFRMMLQEKEEPPPAATERPAATETHALAAANQQKNDRLRNAFGIGTDYVEGSSFLPERKEREKEKRELERKEREEKKEQERLEREKQQKYALVEESEDSDSPPKKQSRKKKKKNKNRESSESPSPSPRRGKKKTKKKKKKNCIYLS